MRIICKLGIATVCAASVVALGAWSLPSSQQRNPAPSELGRAAIFQARIPELAAYVNRHPGDFGGLYLDDASGTVYVDLATSASSSAAAGLKHEIASVSATARTPAGAAGRRVAVATRVVRYSQRQLDATMKQITSREPWATLTRPLLASWGPDPRSDTVQVGLTHLNRQVEASAATAFGGRVSLVRQNRASGLKLAIHVRHLKMVQVTMSKLAKLEMTRTAGAAGHASRIGIAPQPSRFLDVAPYFGGDAIASVTPITGGGYTLGLCTAGFAWTSPAMSTAGHCGPTGTQYYQGYYDSSAGTFYYTGTMGTAYSTQWGAGRIDFQLMNGTPYDPWVYTGVTAASPVDQWTTAFVGQQYVCTDGAVTLENCNAEVADVSRCIPYSTGFKVCGLDIYASTDGSTIVQPGDSGGPAYWYDGNNIGGYPTVAALGIISGRIGPTQGLITNINIAISTMNDGSVATQAP